MATAIEEAVQRASLSQTNHMEMLTFRLTDEQLYGINVFKIIEILECPKRIDRMPHSHPTVKGAIDFRGKAIAAIDLSEAVGLDSKNFSKELAYLLICEYNRQLTAFIIHAPETLLTKSWSEIHKPEGMNAVSLVAIAYADTGETIMLLDIEGILADVVGIGKEDEKVLSDCRKTDFSSLRIVLVDDSKTARIMLQSLLSELGCSYTSFSSASQVLEYFNTEEGKADLIISDIEMPGMDGFTLTRSIRQIDALKDIKIILHSSMSNPSNRLKAEQSGADDFVAKFEPGFLAERISTICSLQ